MSTAPHITRLRFKVGDLARIVVSSRPEIVGAVCTVRDVGPMLFWGLDSLTLGVCDYVLLLPNDAVGCAAMDYQLQPINPPAEPASLTRTTAEEVEA